MRGERTQWYIGTPNGVVLCIDEKNKERIRGRIYHAYQEEATPISTFEEMVFKLEEFYDSINFPHPTTNDRSFQEQTPHPAPRKGREKIMSDNTLLERHGDLGSFIIRVQHRQNSSWQGRITWMEEDKTVRFRSIFEMIKLVESALDTIGPGEEAETEASWD